jgi:hypothetical protein
MTEKIRFLKEKGKLFTKEDARFYSKAPLEELEQAEANAVAVRYWWYEGMLKAGTYGPGNPPPVSGLDYHRWLLKKYGLKWYADYARRREYTDNPAGIPGRLRAMGVPEADIEAVINPLAAIRKKNSKICSIANSIPRSVSRSEAFACARNIVQEGCLELKIAGVTFGNRQIALQRLTTYDPSEIEVTLSPEQENPVDKNAVEVMVRVNGGNRYRIGYVPAESAKTVKVFRGNAHLKVIPGTTYGARLTLAIA